MHLESRKKGGVRGKFQTIRHNYRRAQMPQQQRMHMNRKGIKQQIIESTKQQQLEKKLSKKQNAVKNIIDIISIYHAMHTIDENTFNESMYDNIIDELEKQEPGLILPSYNEVHDIEEKVIHNEKIKKEIDRIRRTTYGKQTSSLSVLLTFILILSSIGITPADAFIWLLPLGTILGSSLTIYTGHKIGQLYRNHIPASSNSASNPVSSPAPPVPSPARRPNAPKANAPKANAPKANAPKANAPKANAPKANAPKAPNAPKANAPKAPNAPNENSYNNLSIADLDLEIQKMINSYSNQYTYPSK
jgi:hypothetical protein